LEIRRHQCFFKKYKTSQVPEKNTLSIFQTLINYSKFFTTLENKTNQKTVLNVKNDIQILLQM